jgi:hypothetical protein
MMRIMMIISPFGQCGCGRPLRGMRCIHINQITTAVGTHHRGSLAIQFVKGQVVPVDQFLRVLRNTEGFKEHRIIVEGKMHP